MRRLTAVEAEVSAYRQEAADLRLQIKAVRGEVIVAISDLRTFTDRLRRYTADSVPPPDTRRDA